MDYKINDTIYFKLPDNKEIIKDKINNDNIVYYNKMITDNEIIIIKVEGLKC